MKGNPPTRLIDPQTIQPIQNVQPIQPIQPIQNVQPIQLIQPIHIVDCKDKTDCRSLFDHVGEDYTPIEININNLLINNKPIKTLCNFDSGVELVLQKVKGCFNSAKDAAFFMKRRAAIEEDYAKALLKLATSNDILQAQTSYSTAMTGFYSIHEKAAQSKLLFSQKINELSTELVNLSKNTERFQSL